MQLVSVVCKSVSVDFRVIYAWLIVDLAVIFQIHFVRPSDYNELSMN